MGLVSGKGEGGAFLFCYATSSHASSLLFPTYSSSPLWRVSHHQARCTSLLPFTTYFTPPSFMASHSGRTPTFLLSVLILTLINLLATPIAAAGDDCYWRASNTITPVSPGWFACNNTQVQPSGAQLCCISGSQCGEQSICHSNTGCHVGGCTDGSYGIPCVGWIAVSGAYLSSFCACVLLCQATADSQGNGARAQGGHLTDGHIRSLRRRDLDSMERYLQPVGVLRQQRLRRQSAFEVLLRHPTSKLDTQSNGAALKQRFRNNELCPAYLSKRQNEHCRNFILDQHRAREPGQH